MPEFFWYLLLFAVYGWLNGYLSIKLYHWYNRRRDTKFMKYIRIRHPDSVITLSSVDASEREALDKIKEQLDASS